MAKGRGIQLLVFDWAGTTVDYGSSAPETVFERVFESAGIHLTRDEINRPMGMEKKSTYPSAAVQRKRRQTMGGGIRQTVDRG